MAKMRKHVFCVGVLAAFAAGAATIDCGDAELSLDGLGRIAGLRDRSTGRQLVAKAVPMFVVSLRDGRQEAGIRLSGLRWNGDAGMQAVLRGLDV